MLLDLLLAKDVLHSVRDSYTEQKCRELGIDAVNTGCPTIWSLTKNHCAAVPTSKSEHALITLTCYDTNPRLDRLLYETTARNYSKVYVWPQSFEDYNYAKEICGGSVEFVDPALEAYDQFLTENVIDHVGVRLHGGIRALQHRRRSIIIGIDNRGFEMARDFNLPSVRRDAIGDKLEAKINGSWRTEIWLNERAIQRWKAQFTGSVKEARCPTSTPPPEVASVTAVQSRTPIAFATRLKRGLKTTKSLVHRLTRSLVPVRVDDQLTRLYRKAAFLLKLAQCAFRNLPAKPARPNIG
jgi:hypothetical protein